MRIPVARNPDPSTTRRASGSGNNGPKVVVISVVVIAVAIVLIAVFFVYSRVRAKRLRSKRGSTASTPSTTKSKWKWNWRFQRNHEYSDRLQEPENGRSRAGSRDREMTASTNDDTTTPATTAASTVDRNTSVRSVMTLPPYSTAARENERILAREGERGGVDTVLEFPETIDEEEQRREEEMASLYQIRLARRAEAREREERRRLRREARARGDHEALAELRQRAESAASQTTSQALIAEHQAATANRERRVSSVQYAELGVARHDGTRLRANSAESDVRPLLDSAASIGGASSRSQAVSGRTLDTHYRGPSASSIMTVSTRASDEYDFPSAQRTISGGSAGDDFEVISLQESRSRSVSQGPATPGIDTDIPHIDPPNYDGAWEEAPPYESPVDTHAPQLPNPEQLPSIHVTQEPLTPDAGRSTASLHEEPQSR